MRSKQVLLAAVVACGVLLGIVGAGAVVGILMARALASPEPREPWAVRLDRTGPYLVLATEAADRDFASAIQKLRQLHPEAKYLTFSNQDLQAVLPQLKQIQPRYALLVMKPDELDVNFAWRWLAVTARIDDDPLVDVSSGFLTGATPQAAEAFVERIARAASGELQLPGKLIDNLGPNTMAGPRRFMQQRGCFMIPIYGERAALASISHGTSAFTDSRLNSMRDAGLIHFGGHGYPDRIVDGVTGRQAGALELPASVVFNGACYTGVTHRWFEQWTASGTVNQKTVDPADCFCLNLLQNSVVAYLAALHPDHGIPVYQEMEYLAYSGASLGDVMRHTHNGVILGNGGTLPILEPLAADMPSPHWTPSDVMLNGTAARVLFGDPALIVSEPFTTPPFEISTKLAGSDELQITAVLGNTGLKAEYTDTYHADLASNKQLFNDRALITIQLPEGWQNVKSVAVSSVRAGSLELQYRLVGHALEQDGQVRRLHVQVDLPTTGYMQSPFRQRGATVELTVGQ